MDEREDSSSIIVESATEITEKNGSGFSSNFATLRVPANIKSSSLIKINGILKANPGDVELVLEFENRNGTKRLKLPYTVSWTQELRRKINEILEGRW